MRLSDLQIACLLVAGANKRFIERSWLLDAFTVSSKYSQEIETEHTATVNHFVEVEHLKYPSLKIGDVVRLNGKMVGCVESIENDLVKIDILSDGSRPCFYMSDVFDAPTQMVSKYLGKNKLSSEAFGDTSVGRFVWNMVSLQYPFDFNLFSYQNYVWSPKKIVELVKNELVADRATIEQFEKFYDYSYFIGHMTELCVPNITTKALETNPKVTEVKQKFIKEHAGQMHDPIVIRQLESELTKLDREYIGDDPSSVFFDGLGQSEWNLARKKIFLTVGGIPAFDNSTSDMDFIPNSLMEGWTVDAIPSIANEIRKGSYDRGVETAKGGAETKLLFRAFQDTVVSEDDCGTTRTIDVDCSEFDGKQFIGRTIRVGNKDVVITSENLAQYVSGKVIKLYSPLTCETKYNFCYKCCGKNAKNFGAKVLGLQTIKLSSKFMMLSMKNMHGTVLTIRSNNLKDVLL